MSFEELKAAVFALPPKEKRTLARDLVRSADDDEVPPLTQEQLEELERREAYLKEHPESLLTWDEVYQRLKERYGC